MKAKITIFLLTLGIGFIPLLLLSVYLQAFWVTSPYDFPFVLIPSVFIGDLLFLPVLNYRIYVSLLMDRRTMQPKVFWVSTLSALALSLLVNSYSHYLWTRDLFTGFMDIIPGQLSIAGWWHWGYSVVQSMVIFTFVLLWLRFARGMVNRTFRYYERTWFVFILFTLLNVPGFFLKYFLILRGTTFWLMFRNELSSFIPLFYSIIIWLSAIARNGNQKPSLHWNRPS